MNRQQRSQEVILRRCAQGGSRKRAQEESQTVKIKLGGKRRVGEFQGRSETIGELRQEFADLTIVARKSHLASRWIKKLTARYR